MKTLWFLGTVLLLGSFCRADDSGSKYYVGFQAGTGLLNPYFSQGVGLEAGKAWASGLRSGLLVEDDHRQDAISWNRYYEFALTEGYFVPVGKALRLGVDLTAGPVLDYYFYDTDANGIHADVDADLMQRGLFVQGDIRLEADLYRGLYLDLTCNRQLLDSFGSGYPSRVSYAPDCRAGLGWRY